MTNHQDEQLLPIKKKAKKRAKQAVFKDGERWSWKDMNMDDGESRTSFYHFLTKQAALKSAMDEYVFYNTPYDLGKSFPLPDTVQGEKARAPMPAEGRGILEENVRNKTIEECMIAAGSHPCAQYGPHDQVLFATRICLDISERIRALKASSPDRSADPQPMGEQTDSVVLALEDAEAIRAVIEESKFGYGKSLPEEMIKRFSKYIDKALTKLQAALNQRGGV